MVKHKYLRENIPPENRLTIEEKLKERGIEFLKIQLVKSGKRIGVFCPELSNTLVKDIKIQRDTFMFKEDCKACPRWLGGSGRFYYCLTKK